MNKNSIFFKVTLFFIVLLLTTYSIIYIGYNITKQQQVDILITKYMKTLFRVHKNIVESKIGPRPLAKNDMVAFPPPPPPPKIKLEKDEFNNELLKYDLEISKIDYVTLKQKAVLISSELEWELYEYEGFKYFYKKDRFPTLLIKDNIKMADKTTYVILLTILLNIIFIMFYIYIIKKLQPLQRLKNNIVKFSQGEMSIDTSCEGLDEISEVSNEFNNAINEIRQLTESRNLFLRNIMHELKTPITKGSLVSDMMVDGKHKESLKRAFARLQYLLHEFAKIEQLTSKNIQLQKDEYRVIDMIDQAIDILLIHRDKLIFNIEENLVLNVDFQLFSLALKNLIDNGVKYGESDVIIDVKKDQLSIITVGKKLEKDFQAYLKPFNRKYETSKHSLGLGLYIVENILKVHGLSLSYKYQKNQNIFYIKL